MITRSDFKPAWWLPGPHLQTLWVGMVRRTPAIAVRKERLELPDGDFVDLAWTTGPADGRPLVCVFHGLEGSLDSPYASGTLGVAESLGLRGVLMHFRGCSGEPNRLPRAYHSGDTEDIRFFLRTVREREPDTTLGAVGFSLGGNALLKYLGEEGEASPIHAAASVSAPLHLATCAERMGRGFSRVYQWHLLRSLKATAQEKLHLLSDSPVDAAAIPKMNTFWDFDDGVTAPLHGFDSAADYYERSSSRQYLPKVRTQTLILHAEDDPFMTPAILPELSELPPSVRVELSAGGGHVGFVTGPSPFQRRYWLEDRLRRWFTEMLT